MQSCHRMELDRAYESHRAGMPPQFEPHFFEEVERVVQPHFFLLLWVYSNALWSFCCSVLSGDWQCR